MHGEMMEPIQAIYENGVFHPIHPVSLPEKSLVQVILMPPAMELNQDLDAIHAVLDQRYDTGIRDLAARHNEHQP
jgi:predicted DNA-binding antitoxin AbrB/MazE fold protein